MCIQHAFWMRTGWNPLLAVRTRPLSNLVSEVNQRWQGVQASEVNPRWQGLQEDFACPTHLWIQFEGQEHYSPPCYVDLRGLEVLVQCHKLRLRDSMLLGLWMAAIDALLVIYDMLWGCLYSNFSCWIKWLSRIEPEVGRTSRYSKSVYTSVWFCTSLYTDVHFCTV